MSNRAERRKELTYLLVSPTAVSGWSFNASDDRGQASAGNDYDPLHERSRAERVAFGASQANVTLDRVGRETSWIAR